VNANEKAVAEVLSKYQDALNKSDTDAVMKLYAFDAVFMPQNSPWRVGTDEVRGAYDAVFQTIKLTVKFNVAEVVEIAPNWVFARSNSAGTVKVHATGPGVRRPIRNFPVSENRWGLEDRALLLFHNQPGTCIGTKRTNHGHDESRCNSRAWWA
jgi:uncharacterized protein (TIGR02246 family)